jgi:hypothetical protein
MQTYNAHNHTLILLKDFMDLLKQGFPFNQDSIAEDDENFLNQLTALINALAEHDQQAVFDGQAWLSRLFRNYPAYAPHMGREVLWFFGGEALHFMPDEEITKFQQLENAIAEAGDDFDFLKTKQDIFQQQ